MVALAAVVMYNLVVPPHARHRRVPCFEAAAQPGAGFRRVARFGEVKAMRSRTATTRFFFACSTLVLALSLPSGTPALAQQFELPDLDKEIFRQLREAYKAPLEV